MSLQARIQFKLYLLMAYIHDYADHMAFNYPKTWIYSWSLFGMATGLAIYAALGAVIGLAFGAPALCAQLGMASYAMWFATKVDAIKANADSYVQLLKEMNS